MEKGVSQACKSDRKQVNSLLKVLRPKVYITDSSSFKRLVQELTGNGSKPISSSTLPNQELFEKVPVIEIEDHGEPESSIELSVDSPEFCIQTLSPLPDFADLQTSWLSTQTDVSPYQELDSWPLEIDPFIFYDGYSFQNEQEICISDYDLSELYNSL